MPLLKLVLTRKHSNGSVSCLRSAWRSILRIGVRKKSSPGRKIREPRLLPFQAQEVKVETILMKKLRLKASNAKSVGCDSKLRTKMKMRSKSLSLNLPNQPSMPKPRSRKEMQLLRQIRCAKLMVAW